MDGSRFDRLTKTLTEPRSRRGLSRLLGSLAVGGPLALLGVAESEAKKKPKVTLCHNGQTISVSKKAKKAHLKHGDTLGACACTPTCAGKQCGPDGCGSVCGTCPSTSQTCSADGTCTCLSSQRTCPSGECVPTGGCCSGNDCLNINAEPGECVAGTCFYRPKCAQAGVRCTENAWGCCGGCSTATGSSLCTKSAAGSPCYTAADCNSGLVCVRFTCQAPA